VTDERSTWVQDWCLERGQVGKLSDCQTGFFENIGDDGANSTLCVGWQVGAANPHLELHYRLEHTRADCDIAWIHQAFCPVSPTPSSTALRVGGQVQL